MRNLIIGFFAAMFSVSSFAGSLTVTNTFTADTTARASEVNQNFTDVKTAVDDNDGRIKTNALDISTNAGNISDNASNITANTNALAAIVSPLSVLANGTPVGIFIGFDHTYRGVNLINSKGYLFRIRTRYDGSRPEGAISNRYDVFYQSADCTGPEYIQKALLVNSPPAGMIAANHGVVFDVNGSVYYLPANSISSNFSVSSYHSANDLEFTCQPNPITDDFYAVFANDSLVTGVSSLTFPLPITLGQ